MGTKTAATSRGGSGSKRSRAAEVHNLSERVSKISFDVEGIYVFLQKKCDFPHFVVLVQCIRDMTSSISDFFFLDKFHVKMHVISRL